MYLAVPTLPKQEYNNLCTWKYHKLREKVSFRWLLTIITQPAQFSSDSIMFIYHQGGDILSRHNDFPRDRSNSRVIGYVAASSYNEQPVSPHEWGARLQVSSLNERASIAPCECTFSPTVISSP